uniref:Uncharacterized protein n=1 Tax=Xenopus tropicalis TaxID=8364 RepID=A0A1B8Y0Z7_XENTR
MTPGLEVYRNSTGRAASAEKDGNEMDETLILTREYHCPEATTTRDCTARYLLHGKLQAKLGESFVPAWEPALIFSYKTANPKHENYRCDTNKLTGPAAPQAFHGPIQLLNTDHLIARKGVSSYADAPSGLPFYFIFFLMLFLNSRPWCLSALGPQETSDRHCSAVPSITETCDGQVRTFLVTLSIKKKKKDKKNKKKKNQILLRPFLPNPPASPHNVIGLDLCRRWKPDSVLAGQVSPPSPDRSLVYKVTQSRCSVGHKNLQSYTLNPDCVVPPSLGYWVP